MSASQEKKRRQAEYPEKMEKEQKAAKAKKKKRIIITTVVVVLVVVLIAFSIVMNSDILYSTGTALKIGSYSFTAAEVNYFYYSAYYNEYDSYGDYASYIIDTSTSLFDQEYTDGYSWAEHFMDTAVENMTRVVMLVEAAEEAGFELSDDDLDEIESNISNYEILASYYGYKSADAYYSATFGNGVDSEVIRSCMEMVYLADAYEEYMTESFTYTDEEIDEYYDENSDSYDAITYRMYYVTGTESNDTNMEEAWEKVEYLLEATSEEDFAQRVYEVCLDSQKDTYTDLDTTRHTYRGSYISSNYNDWLLDESRESGDITAIEYSSDETEAQGYYVVYFISRDSHEYYSADIRYIFIEAEEDDDGEITEDAMAAAEVSAQDVYDSWLEDEATEDTFSDLALSYSDDSDTKYYGGLDEEISVLDVGSFSEEIIEWVLSEDREAGDNAMFEVKETGYYIVYYVETNDELYCRTLARTDMQSNAYDEWEEAQLENYTAEEGLMMSRVGR